jgi:CO/xanthine dehydrogenase Mo-binding subunit
VAGRLRILRAEARNLVGNHASLADLARESTFEAEGEFFCDHMTYPYVAHLAVVAVDRDTGGLDVRRYLVAYDIGRAINPMLVKGQIREVLPKASGARCTRNFCTMNSVSRLPARSPIT